MLILLAATVLALPEDETPVHLKPFPKAEDVKDIPTTDLRAGGNKNMRYGLIGPRKKAPEAGYKLLLVLPGGSASPGFHPFVKRIAKHATGADYLVAHLVAPVWDKDWAKRIVWPTAKLKYPAVKFTTEEFIAAVVKDIAKKHKIQPGKVFALGWSSGGPPVYASLLSKNSPLDGAMIAMSVFKPKQLPALTAAKGKSVWLYHSPQDFIPIRMAKQARDDLAKAGARTTLLEYKGGHGWRGPIFANLKRGIEFLAK